MQEREVYPVADRDDFEVNAIVTDRSNPDESRWHVELTIRDKPGPRSNVIQAVVRMPAASSEDIAFALLRADDIVRQQIGSDATVGSANPSAPGAEPDSLADIAAQIRHLASLIDQLGFHAIARAIVVSTGLSRFEDFEDPQGAAAKMLIETSQVLTTLAQTHGDDRSDD